MLNNTPLTGFDRILPTDELDTALVEESDTTFGWPRQNVAYTMLSINVVYTMNTILSSDAHVQRRID